MSVRDFHARVLFIQFGVGSEGIEGGFMSVLQVPLGCIRLHSAYIMYDLLAWLWVLDLVIPRFEIYGGVDRFCD